MRHKRQPRFGDGLTPALGAASSCCHMAAAHLESIAAWILEEQRIIRRGVFRAKHWSLDVTRTGGPDHFCNSVQFCLCVCPERQPRGIRNMRRVFDQTDEFRLGMITTCVIRYAKRRLAKIGKTDGWHKQRVERFHLSQATNTEINVVKQPLHNLCGSTGAIADLRFEI